MADRARIRDAIAAAPERTLLAVDFDGTLSPIVDDPAQAVALPAAVDALARLGPRLGRIAVVTGRPPRQAVDLGGFDRRSGLEGLVVHGHYGTQRWEAGRVTGTVPTDGLRAALAELPAVLAGLDASEARIEDKELAFAVHTRGLGTEVFDRLLRPLTEFATRHGLRMEPGRQVIELRPPGRDKGATMRELIDATRPQVVVFVGDDLGDLPAFEAVREFATESGNGFCVCSASAEEVALAEIADLVLDGPPAVAEWLTEIADALTPRFGD